MAKVNVWWSTIPEKYKAEGFEIELPEELMDIAKDCDIMITQSNRNIYTGKKHNKNKECEFSIWLDCSGGKFRQR